MITTATPTAAAAAAAPAHGRAQLASTSCLRHHAYPVCPSRRASCVARGASDDAAADADAAAMMNTPPSSSSSMDWRYETIAGRCAMAGYAVGASREAAEGLTYVEQLGAHAFSAALICAAIAWASVKPFEFNPQEYDADPSSLDGKKGMSGFLVMDELNFNASAERANGRACMVGIVGTALVEAVFGSTIF